MGQAAKQDQNVLSPIAGMPDWAAEPIRIDPYRLPARLGTDVNAGPVYTVDRLGAVVKRRLPGGLTVSMALPRRAFLGVAARAVATSMGAYRVTLELHHADPMLCVPLLVSEDLDDIAADWHAWSRRLNLPMLIVDAEENASSVRAMLGEIMVEPPLRRRKRRESVRRRPNFLRRRKAGTVGEVIRLHGTELTARR